MIEWRKMARIHCVRIWQPDSARIRTRYFLRKSEILFGSDKEAHLRLSELTGLTARLDFEREELHLIDEDRIEPAPEESLFQIGPYVFQWKRTELTQAKWRWSALGLILGSILVVSFGLYTPPRKKPDCNFREVKVASGAWGASSASPDDQDFFEELSATKKSFQSAIHEKDWVKARAELLALTHSISTLAVASQPKPRPGCDVWRPMAILEGHLSQHLIRARLKSKDLSGAAQELRNFLDKYETHPERIGLLHLENEKARILQQAEKLYFKGYRMEDEDADQASELMDQAEEVCAELALKPQCFRSELSDSEVSGAPQDSRQKRVPSNDP